MSRSSRGSILGVTLFAAVVGGGFAPLLAAVPIAHYPLQSDGVDATGINDPMLLDTAPFQNGGVYCNGIYVAQPGGFTVKTPLISSLNFESLAFSVEFKIDELPTDFRRPILVGGHSYRWLGAEINPNGKLGFLHNNSNHTETAIDVSINVWHQIVITYESTSRTGRLYLDSQPAMSAEFDLEQNGDRDFQAYNPANATAFKGILRELVVYDTWYDPTPADGTSWGAVKALYR